MRSSYLTTAYSLFTTATFMTSMSKLSLCLRDSPEVSLSDALVKKAAPALFVFVMLLTLPCSYLDGGRRRATDSVCLVFDSL